MKIRSGFVSNSSSSSFVLIVDKKLWNSEIEKLNKDQKKVVDIYTDGGSGEFKDFLIFNWMTGNNGEYILEEIESALTDEDGEKTEKMIEWFDKFIEKLRKQKDKVKIIVTSC